MCRSAETGGSAAAGGSDTDDPIARPGSILFVCGMNAIRSPMAEHLARDLFKNQVFVQSAGVHAGEPDGFMAAVMGERGLSVEEHTPSTLDDLEDNYFDLVVTLSPEAHHRAMEMTRSNAVDVEYWPTADPSTVAGRREQVIEAYRQVRDTLELKLKKRFGL